MESDSRRNRDIETSKEWVYKGHPCLSGEILSTRVDASALVLTPLRLQSGGMWDPVDHYWGEESEPLEEWQSREVKAKIAEGLASLDRGEGLDGEEAFRELQEPLL